MICKLFFLHLKKIQLTFVISLSELATIIKKNTMKKILLLTLTLITLSTYSQEEKIQMITKNDNPEFGSNDFILNNFQGIEKLNISFSNSEKLKDKNFKIIIRKYKNGKIEIEKNVIDTKAEELPKIGKNFYFSILSQHILQNEKIGFFFPNFMNKQIFDINKKFKDGTFSLRNVCGDESDKIDFELGKEIQIALITPPNDNPNKGNLGYCEVSKGNIDVEKWYEQYKISEFFLIYLIIEK